ncbi:MAG: tyrosine-protein phosphatase [Muribaculaceae bacterium]|nr:tyrosine-protein phosphatase [Muribaculaceae bacterium]
MKLPLSLNFRDLGGIALQDGNAVPHGLYMRSGKLSILSPEQCAAMCHEHNIGCIIDLRTATEAEEFPDPIPDGVRYVQIPILSDATVGITHETGSDPVTVIRRLKDEPERLRALMPDMEELYQHMVEDEYSSQQVKKVLEVIAQNARQGTGTLFHCTAGKDRTGIIAMNLLRSLGASDKDIVKDYMRTNRSALWPTLKKCAGIFMLTHNMAIVKAAYRCFMANEKLLHIAMTHTTDSLRQTLSDFPDHGQHIGKSLHSMRGEHLLAKDKYRL